MTAIQTQRMTNEHFGANLSKGLVLGNLPFWDLAQGVVFLEDGKMEFGIEIFPPSPVYASGDMLEASWSSLKTVLQLGVAPNERARLIIEAVVDDGQMIDQYRHLAKSPIDIVNQVAWKKADRIEELRREGKIMRYRMFVCCTVEPRIKRTKGLAYNPAELEQDIANAHRVRANLINYLENAKCSPRAATSQDVFGLMWNYLNPGLVPAQAPAFMPFEQRPGYLHQALLKANPQLRSKTLKEQLVGSPINTTNHTRLQVGSRFVATTSFHRSPSETETGMIRNIMLKCAQGGNSYYIVVDFIHQPLGPTLRKYEGDMRKYYSAAEAVGMPPNPGAIEAFKEVKEAMSHMAQTGDHEYTAAITVVAISRSVPELEYMKQQINSAFSSFPGSMPVDGSFQTLSCYFSALPFSGRIGEFPFDAMESNAADLFPPLMPWTGLERPMVLFPNRWNGLTKVDLFSPTARNWNGAVLASSGWGKSFLNQTNLMALLRFGCEITIVDQKNDYRDMVISVGGTPINFAPGGDLAYNMFDLDPGATSPDDDKKEFLYAGVRILVGRSEDPQVNAIEASIIRENIDRVYRLKKGDQVAQLGSLLTAFTATTQLGDRRMTEDELKVARGLAIRLKPFTGDSVYGKFLDAPTKNINLNTDVRYFDISALTNNPELSSLAMLIINDLIWRGAKKNPSRYKFALLEEMWALLKTEEMRNFVDRLHRLARAYNLAVYSTTQRFADLTEVKGLLANISYLFLGGMNPGDLKIFSEVMEVQDSIIETIKSLNREHANYAEWLFMIDQDPIKNGDVIKLVANKFEYYLYSSYGPDRERREKYIKSEGSVLGAINKMIQEGSR